MEFMEFLVLRCEVRLLPELNRRALGTRCMVCVLVLVVVRSVVCCNRPIFLEPNRIWN